MIGISMFHVSKGKSATLLRALQNPTKFKVLVLLAKGEPMTVTQMAGLIDVSRPNLYHFVSEMVDEGILLEPESRVKGNYVEKYYRLDSKAIELEDVNDWRKAVVSSGPKEKRDLLYAGLISLSMQFRILAEQVAGMDDKSLERLDDAFKKHRVLLAYGTMDDAKYEVVVRKLVELNREDEGEKAAPLGRNQVAMLAIPDFLSS